MRGPIFIGGLDRSGKTYLRFMLTSGDGLVISRRTDLWPRFYRRFGDLSNADNLKRCLSKIADNKHIRSLGIDLARLSLEFEAGSRSYERLFALIHLQYALVSGKERWGDQSELLEQQAESILKAYPGSRILHLLRDPRDRYEAVLQKSKRRGGVGVATARWLYSAALAEKHLEKYRGQYKVVRYEDMVREPEKTLRDICDFIGETYNPKMLKMSAAPRFANQLPAAGDESALTPLSTEYIGRFRGQLSGFEVAFIEYFAGRLMRKFGYVLENEHFSLFGHLPSLAVNAARLAGWRLLNAGNG